MVRSMLGFAGFALVVLLGLKLLGIITGLLGTILWFAFWGFIFYLILRLIFPSAADRVRDTIKGRPASD